MVKLLNEPMQYTKSACQLNMKIFRRIRISTSHACHCNAVVTSRIVFMCALIQSVRSDFEKTCTLTDSMGANDGICGDQLDDILQLLCYTRGGYNKRSIPGKYESAFCAGIICSLRTVAMIRTLHASILISGCSRHNVP